MIDKYYITIVASTPTLGSTIVISGNDLRKIKNCIKRILPIARNVILERSLLSMCKFYVPKPSQLKRSDDEFTEYIGKF